MAGRVDTPNGKPLRIVLKFNRAADESLRAEFYSIDQTGTPFPSSAASQQGSTIKVTVPSLGGNYEGRLAADGNTITGTWTQGQPLALNLVKATPQTAWAIPDPPPPPKAMPANVKPAFDVSTIKPSRPDATGNSILVGRGGSNLFTTTNTSLNQLIVMAWGLHPRQLTGLPSWAEDDKYDITAKPNSDGVPNVEQLKEMVRDLLTERFQLKMHTEKREMTVYAITVAKGGPKLSPAAGQGNLPGFGGPPGNVRVANATIEEFAGFLQGRLVDQPAVDQTGLKGKFDFTIKWIPDQALMAAAGPNAPPPPGADSPDVAPDLFAAFEKQLGLKLEKTKAPVEVQVVDRVAKPSDN